MKQDITRSTTRRRVVSAALLLLLCFAFALAAFCQLKRIREETPAAMWVHDARGLDVSYTQAKMVYKARSISYGFCSVSFKTAVSQLGKVVEVEAAGANAYWGEHARLDIVSGQWYSEATVVEGENWAAIPQALALELYAGVEFPPGAEIQLAGEQYRVSAVYAPGSGLIADVTESAMPMVYLSNLPLEESRLPVQHMLLVGDVKGVTLLNLATKRFGVPLGGQTADMRDTVALAGQLCYLFVVLAVALPLVWLTLYGINSIIQVYQHHSPFRRRGLLLILRGVVCIGAMLLAAYLLLQGMALPNRYLPPNNILDVPYYIQLVYGYYKNRATMGYVAAFDSRLHLRLWAVALNGMAALALFYAAAYRLRKAVLAKKV